LNYKSGKIAFSNDSSLLLWLHENGADIQTPILISQGANIGSAFRAPRDANAIIAKCFVVPCASVRSGYTSSEG